MLQTPLPLLAWISIMALHDALCVAGNFQRLCNFHIPYMHNIPSKFILKVYGFATLFFSPSIKPKRNNYDNNGKQEKLQQLIYLSNTKNTFSSFFLSIMY